MEKTEKISPLKAFFSQIFNKNPDDLREELSEFFEDLDIKVSNDQLQMILGVVGMIDYTVDKIKIPEKKMVSIPINATKKDAFTAVRKSGHSRIPVYEEVNGSKKYPGILYAKDLLESELKKGRFKLSNLLRKPFVVPETQSLLTLLREMRIKKYHLALTANEHGDISGLITLEDILEEIVGDIKDEFDSSRQPIKEIEHRLYRIDGSLPLSDVNKHLTINLPEEKFNTLAGFVLHELKGNLVENEMITYGQIILTLEKFNGQQIKSVLVKIPPVSQ